jgi:hypothetical protein
MMISCITESNGSLSESLRTLHFSMSAARIRNKPIRFLDPQEKLILELRDEIKRLKQENDVLKGNLSLSRQPSHQFPVSDYLSGMEYHPSSDRLHSTESREFPSGRIQPAPEMKKNTERSANRTAETRLRQKTGEIGRNVEDAQHLPHISSQPTMIRDHAPVTSSSSGLTRSKV